MKIPLKFSVLVPLFILITCTDTALSSSSDSAASSGKTPSPMSRSYYVSPRGSDSNPGTMAFPFRTISRAAAIARAGDTVLIGAGVYYESVKPSYSGEPDKYITYRNYGAGEVIIDAEDGKRPGCIEIENREYLQLIGLTVRGANSYEDWPRAGISITDGSSHIILDNVTAYDNYFGIMVKGGYKPVSFVTVRNSRTFGPNNLGNLHYGIFFYQKVYDSEILDNQIGYTLPEEQSYGIDISTDYPGAQAEGARRIVVAGNEVHHNESQGIHTWNAKGVLISGNYFYENGATGIQIEDGSENIVLENNLSEHNAQKYGFEAGAWIDDSKNVLVRNNILRRNKVGLLVTASDRVIIHDNYLYLNNRGAEHLLNSAGLMVEDSVSNISVTHNTFYKNGTTSAGHAAVSFGVFNPFCSNIAFKNNIVAESVNATELFQDSCDYFESDFNDFFNTRPLAMEWNQAGMDWATYVRRSGQDSHSLTLPPVFENPEALDFSLHATSPLIGQGTVLAWTTNSGTGDTVAVTDASFFSDGFGAGRGDPIVIGDQRSIVIAVNYIHDSIRVDRVIHWDKNDPVSFPFVGTAPDMGAGNLQ